MNIILDTNVILGDPTILARASEKFRFIIPAGVLHELRSHKNKSAFYADFVIRAVNNNTIVIAGATDIRRVDQKYTSRLGEVDSNILCLAIEKTEEDTDTVLVTEDADLSLVATEYKVRTLTLNALRRLLPSAATDNPVVLADARSVNSKQQRYLIVSFVAGVVGTVAVQQIFQHIDKVLPFVATVFGFVTAAITGLAIFWARSRWRLWYGFLEYLVGIVTVWYSTGPNLLDKDKQVVEIIKVVGGLYVMVRGLDNIGKGLAGTNTNRGGKGLS